MNKTPEFIIIGAMKSGTSTIDRNLIVHSQIGFTVTKEPNFFSNNFNKGFDWYLNQFPSDKPILGETSPNYSRLHLYPETVRNMKQFNPDMKIIYIVRDPIDRIVSHLHHNIYRDRLNSKSVEKELIGNEDYILTSSYFFQIKPYLETFDSRNIKVVLFEDFIKNPTAILKDLCNFLNAEYEEIHFKAYNISSKKYLIKFHDTFHKLFGNNKFTDLYHLFWYFMSIKIDRPILTEKSKLFIKSNIKEDIAKFQTIFSLDSSKWNTYEKI